MSLPDFPIVPQPPRSGTTSPQMEAQFRDALWRAIDILRTQFQSTPVPQLFTASGNYTPSPGVKFIRVRIAGGGGGGGSSGLTGTVASNPTVGTSSTFGGTLLVAGGGQIGSIAFVNSYGGSGGVSSIGAGAVGIPQSGSPGGGAQINAAANPSSLSGGMGGNGPFGGGGQAAYSSAGTAAVANSGGGGGGGGSGFVVNVGTGGGGGSGGYAEGTIVNPVGPYAIVIGNGGAGGTAGTSGFAGGAGAKGFCLIEEYF